MPKPSVFIACSTARSVCWDKHSTSGCHNRQSAAAASWFAYDGTFLSSGMPSRGISVRKACARVLTSAHSSSQHEPWSSRGLCAVLVASSGGGNTFYHAAKNSTREPPQEHRTQLFQSTGRESRKPAEEKNRSSQPGAPSKDLNTASICMPRNRKGSNRGIKSSFLVYTLNLKPRTSRTSRPPAP